MQKVVPKVEVRSSDDLPFRIDGYKCSLTQTNYSVSVKTNLSREELYDFLRSHLVPIPLSHIGSEPEGFNLQYTDHASTLAGDFFAHLFAAQLGRIPNPVQWALGELGAASALNLENDLGTEFKTELISEYYRRIDEKDVAWVGSLFSENAVYRRGEQEYLGKSAIMEFYENSRRIEGLHTIDQPIVSGSTVIVRGRFKGSGVNRVSKDVRFTDLWTLDKAKVTTRETYLALGSQYVQE